MKMLQGSVVSLKNQKTVTVLVERRWQHPLYLKYVKRTKKYACHYEDLTLTIGDKVMIKECRPLSKTKHFQVASRVEEQK